MVQNDDESVETFAILPIAKFMSMEKRLKKSEDSDQRSPTPKPSENSESETEVVENLESPPPSPKASTKKKKVKMKYRAAQIKNFFIMLKKKMDLKR